MPLSHEETDRLVEGLEGTRVTAAVLVSPECGFRPIFDGSQILTALRTDAELRWHVSMPLGYSVGPDGIERTPS